MTRPTPAARSPGEFSRTRIDVLQRCASVPDIASSPRSIGRLVYLSALCMRYTPCTAFHSGSMASSRVRAHRHTSTNRELNHTDCLRRQESALTGFRVARKVSTTSRLRLCAGFVVMAMAERVERRGREEAGRQGQGQVRCRVGVVWLQG
jgi:hypothetical protein